MRPVRGTEVLGGGDELAVRLRGRLLLELLEKAGGKLTTTAKPKPAEGDINVPLLRQEIGRESYMRVADFDAKARHWTIAAGTYRVQLARSATDPVESVEVALPAMQLP